MSSVTSMKFELIFKHFPTKILHFLQPVKSKTIGIDLKDQFSEKPISVLYTNVHISKCRKSMNLILVSIILKWKCATYNDSKNSFYPRCHLFPVLWEYLTCLHKCLSNIYGNNKYLTIVYVCTPGQCLHQKKFVKCLEKETVYLLNLLFLTTFYCFYVFVSICIFA